MTLILITLLLTPTGLSSGADVTMQTLDNGLVVAVEENHSTDVAAVRIYVRVGGVFEGPYLGCGISHYCEHLVSSGTTTTRTEQESQEIMASIGGQSNAYTSSDHTCYHIQCPSQHWRTALDLLSDWVMNCAMDSTEVAREKGVILQEIGMGDDEPFRVIYKLLSSKMFRQYELGVPVIGYRDNFARLERADAVRFYRAHYVPNNSIVVVVGDVNTEEVFDLVRQKMGAWERQPVNLPVLHHEPPQTAPRHASREMDVCVATVRIGFPTVSLTHPDLCPLDILACLLGWGESSRLGRRLKDETRLVYSVESYSYTPWFGQGVFYIEARLEPDSLPRTMQVLWEELEAIKRAPPSRAELEKAANQVRASEVFSRQSCQAEASALGRDLVSTGDPGFSWRYVERMRRVKPEDVAEVARRYLLAERQTTALVAPKGSTETGAEQIPFAAGASDVESFDLPNGLRVLIRRVGFAPVVALRAYFGGGSHRETAESNGQFRFLSRMLMEGTRRWSAQELQSRLDQMGTRMSCSSGRFTLSLEMTALSEYLEESLEMAAEILAHPTFPTSRIEKVRQELLAEIKAEDDDWRGEAWKFLARTLYPDHPYGLSPVGRRKVVEAAQVDDLRELFARYVRGANGVVAVYGDVDVVKTRALVEKAFAGLPAGDAPGGAPVPPAPLHADTTAWKLNEKGQVVVCLGFNGVSLGSPDRYALEVLDAVTSGVRLPGGWLHAALRGAEDLVYFVHLVPRWMPHSGHIAVIAQTSVENRRKVVDIIERELERAKRGEFTPEEIAAAKATCIAAQQLYHQDPASQADQAATYELHGLGYGFLDDYATRIQQVTLDDITRVAEQYLGPRVLAMTGPSQAFQ